MIEESVFYRMNRAIFLSFRGSFTFRALKIFADAAARLVNAYRQSAVRAMILSLSGMYRSQKSLVAVWTISSVFIFGIALGLMIDGSVNIAPTLALCGLLIIAFSAGWIATLFEKKV